MEIEVFKIADGFKSILCTIYTIPIFSISLKSKIINSKKTKFTRKTSC